MATNVVALYGPSASTITSTVVSPTPAPKCGGNCNVYKWAIGIETCIIGVTMVVCLIFFHFKSSRWMSKGAASKEPEIGDLKKELEDYKAIVFKNAR